MYLPLRREDRTSPTIANLVAARTGVVSTRPDLPEQGSDPMPEPFDSIPPNVPPEFPPKTPDEIAAQRVIRWCAAALRTIVVCLKGAHVSLPDPPNAEDMGERRIPESLSFALRGTLECVIADDLEPALASLDEAAALTPAALHSQWLERREGVK
jgi:hypothetical protein